MKPWEKILTIFSLFFVAPFFLISNLGCLSRTKDVFLFFGWVCDGRWFLALHASIVVGSIWILYLNAKSKAHFIFWYLVASGALFLLAGWWFVAWAFSHFNMPA